MKSSCFANGHSLDVNRTDCFSRANFIPMTLSEGILRVGTGGG